VDGFNFKKPTLAIFHESHEEKINVDYNRGFYCRFSLAITMHQTFSAS